MAARSNENISETENFFRIFYCLSGIYVKFGVFSKKDQSHSLSITEISNCQTGSYLKVQKAIFHTTLRQTTCYRVQNTTGISTEPISYHSPINLRKKE